MRLKNPMLTDGDIEAISPYGPARATIHGTPLNPDELERLDAYWDISLYLCLGMLYLRDNPLLRTTLQPEHVKARLLGHWGSDAGQCFTYIHFNRLICKYDLNAMYISGPGHGAPAVLSQAYLEGTYSEIYPEISEDLDGLRRFFNQFSFPGGIGSHATPETPGSIHEGGELGYSLSHAFGTVFDNPDLITLVMVGDGEAETGPLATSWHGNKFLNPITDGAVLPVLHLNGYKINNPTILARISHEELEALFVGYGYTPYFVEGSDRASMHQAMAATMEHCVHEIRAAQGEARRTGKAFRPRWPVIVLRSPKGWTGPRLVDNHYLEGSWRAHQIPIADVPCNPDHLKLLEDWMRSYRPEIHFDGDGRIIPELRALAPKGLRRMSANPAANGGTIRRPLNLPDFRSFQVDVDHPGVRRAGNVPTLGPFLREIIRENHDNFRIFGPDETQSNKLDSIYTAGKKSWLGAHFPEDEDGGNLAVAGRVMEMLSEHTVEGWLEGYLLSGRHGLINSYEPFVHVIDSMFNQHAKWLEKCNELAWRVPISSLNILITALVWRQDHNGFTHQDPGFLDVVANKNPDVVRIYLPPDANCLLSVADHCLRSQNYVNVIVSDKQIHLQYLNMDAAIAHCAKGAGIWDWASNDHGQEPDVVMASCGDVPTVEALAATALLRTHLPDIKIRFVNCVDLFRLVPNWEHPHGLTDSEFEELFTATKPVIFNFHSYPWLIHRLTYRRPAQHNIHVCGYGEKGNIDTPLELAIRNRTDRFSLAIDAISRIPRFRDSSSDVLEVLLERRQACVQHAHEFGTDPKHISDWIWPKADSEGRS
ncbi:phosphoketolase family protein [Acidiphilium multivorum]|uniref:phosphoketolase family protein n=1 Tax=Acidiphilium multivorum TaxID=62140 RepID=UPI001F4C4993|nr:phosphoketolase family protein [Acidiphilium multivorum]